MAKGKNLNPADAYRKSLRKKELKKNKAERAKARDLAVVKKDTWDLEDEIKRLEEANDPSEKSRLAELKAELEKINRKKAEYVEEHPEARRLVYRPRRKEGEAEEEIILPKRNLFKKNGLPRHPERSIYYDPVMNPYGVAPPGMPYMERPLLPGEVDSEAESAASDDEIIMPEGPPPTQEEDVQSDEDISLPEGPPSAQGPSIPIQPPLPPGAPPLILPGLVPPPPPPPGAPPPPAGVPIPPFSSVPVFSPGVPPPPPPPGVPRMPPSFLPYPPPPPGFFPRKRSAAALQDPLSSIPHQTFQDHRAAQSTLPTPHPSLPPKPVLVPRSTPGGQDSASSVVTAAATVSAAPQLRNLKREATAFVPTTVKRKKLNVQSSASSKIDAAPSVAPSEGDEELPGLARPDLLNALKDQFGPVPASEPAATTSKAGKKKKDDYEKFMEELSDILGPS